MLAPPFWNVWQAWHALVAAWPRSTVALASSFSIGSSGAAFSAAPGVAAFLISISKPGLAGSGAEKIASAVTFKANTARHVPRTAPTILLNSKESIAEVSRSGLRRRYVVAAQ